MMKLIDTYNYSLYLCESVCMSLYLLDLLLLHPYVLKMPELYLFLLDLSLRSISIRPVLTAVSVGPVSG